MIECPSKETEIFELAFISTIVSFLGFIVGKLKPTKKTAPLPQPPDGALLAEIGAYAVEIARGAGAILGRHFGSSLNIEYKDKNQSDPVTNADKESQDFLRRAILERFPGHGVLGEEDKEDESPAPDFVWVLDPLDGTKNFLSGLPLYACSVGVLYRGAPVAGAVFIPWPADGGGAVLHARRGGGAFMDDQPISVLRAEEPRGNALVTLPGGLGAMFRFDKPMRGKVGEVRMTGSIAYELVMVARGVTQYTITTAPALWDAAGGVMVVMEAGGLVMRGRRVKKLLGLTSAIEWQPLESFIPNWQSGKTTLKDLRQWRAPLYLGSPGVVRYVASNTRSRAMLRWRVRRMLRRMRRGRR